MKIFVSYRRDDTGGRAGRLADALADRYGRRNVFQDVTGVAPGVDFLRQVETTIAASDVVLVVIGPQWLSSTDPDGRRRVDRDDDFVRQEVTAALDAELPVVPVLVDGASLPPADELPDDLAPLVHRQAVDVRDVSWHADVDDLVRRLEGETRGERRRPRWVWVAAAAALVVVAVAAVLALRDGGDDGDGDSSTEVPPCEPLGPDAEALIAEADSTAEIVDNGAAVRLTADGGELVTDAAGDTTRYLVRVWLRNETEPDTEAEVPYFSIGLVHNLLVDGVSTGEPVCFGPVTGDPNVEPGEQARADIGFRGGAVDSGATVVIEMGDIDLTIGATP